MPCAPDWFPNPQGGGGGEKKNSCNRRTAFFSGVTPGGGGGVRKKIHVNFFSAPPPCQSPRVPWTQKQNQIARGSTHKEDCGDSRDGYEPYSALVQHPFGGGCSALIAGQYAW